MKSNLTRYLTLFLALVLTLTLAACGKTGDTGGPSKEGDKAGDIDISEFVTISHLSLGDKPKQRTV